MNARCVCPIDRRRHSCLHGASFCGWGSPARRHFPWKRLPNDLDPRAPGVSRILEHNQRTRSEHIKPFGFDFAERLMQDTESYQSRALNVHNPEWIAEGALQFIDQNKDRPFFLYCSHTLHHIPHPQPWTQANW